jgi:5-methylcytosine-specific restriction endonuclease McrA
MPRAPQKCLKCLRKATFRGYCDEHQPPREAWVKTGDSPDRSFLKTKEWDEQRVRVLDRDRWLCKFKLSPKCLVRATQVDHIVPVWYSGRDKAEDVELASICESCHGKKSSYEGYAAKKHRQLLKERGLSN